MGALINFIYDGEEKVEQDNLDAFSTEFETFGITKINVEKPAEKNICKFWKKRFL